MNFDSIRHWRALVVLALGFGLGWESCGGATLRVAPGGADTAPGDSWGAALRSVTRAMELAAAGDEIWVAAGSYTNQVVLKPGVRLYGGFAGTETLRAESDWVTHETVLDGGGTNLVVLVLGGGADTVLDGFTIQHGLGCGVRVFDSAATVSHNRIRLNISSSVLAYGAGVSVKNNGSGAVALIKENVILDNYAFDGGGIACIDASPQIVGNLIVWNMAAQNGGGISCWRESSPLIANNRIHGNTASWGTGAVPIGGGGIFATADDLDGRPHPTARSSPLIRNNVVTANGASKGGGIALADANGGVPVLLNNTVVANSGSGVLWGSSALVPIAPVLVNNLVAFNPWGFEQFPGTPTNAVLQNNCVFGNRVHTMGGNYRGLPDLTSIDGNLSVDPLLASVPFGNLHLQPGSPCRNAGQDRGAAMGTEDIDGEPRVAGAAVDIGADESAGASWDETPRVLRVAAEGDDALDGSSWPKAKRTVGAALEAIRPTGGEVWVKTGTHAGHFWLPAFVHLYGGFAGTETQREERAPAMNLTTVDGGGKPNVVISGQGGFGVSTLDGFTITGGGVYTAGTNLNKYGLGGHGGGVLISVSSPVITNNVITRNSLAYDNTTNQLASYGAGIACETSFAVIAGNTITDNEILNDFDGSGGGIYCLSSMPLIAGNRIAGNQAASGPAVYCWGSTPSIVGNTITSNSMYVRLPLFRGAGEGAISIHLADDALVEGNQIHGNTAATGAGLYFAAYRAGEVRNNVFAGNRAYDPTAFGGMGGGLYVMATTSVVSSIRVVHNTIVGNVASNLFAEAGGGMAFTLMPPATNLVIANNLIVSNSSGILQTPTTPMPAPQLHRNNLHNTRDNYLSVSAGATDVSRPTAFLDPVSGDYRLALGTADIDDADPAYAVRTDAAGVPRPLDGDADGVAKPDLGAHEFVHPTADTDSDGLPDAWECAMRLDATVSDAGMDSDGDGASNGQEYLAGTHPLDLESRLSVRAERASGPAAGVRLWWVGRVGRTYEVRHTAVLGAGADWQPVQTGLIGTGAELSFETAEVSGGAGFYCVRAVLQP